MKVLLATVALATVVTALSASSVVAVTPAPRAAPAASVRIITTDPSGDVTGTSPDTRLRAETDVTRVRYVSERDDFWKGRMVRFTVVHGPATYTKDDQPHAYAVTTFTANMTRYKAITGIVNGSPCCGLYVFKGGTWKKVYIPRGSYGTASLGLDGIHTFTTEIDFPVGVLSDAKVLTNLKTTMLVPGTDLKDVVTPTGQPLLLFPAR